MKLLKLNEINMDKKKIFRNMLLFISLSLIILITIFFFKNKNRLPKSFNVQINKTGIDVSIEKFYLTEEKEGKKQWELNADKAEIINSEGITRLKNIDMNIFQKGGDGITVSADRGVIQNDSNDIELIGNIEVLNQDGYKLKTESLKWLSEQKKVLSDKDVEITGEDLNITGKKMTVDVENKIFEISGGIKVIYYGEKKGS